MKLNKTKGISLKKELERFKKLLKEYREEVLYEAERKSFPKRGEIRKLCVIPPLYFLISKEVAKGPSQKIYEAIVLSEEVALGSLGANTPIFVFKNVPLMLVSLPFWIYLTDEFLLDYSEVIAEVDETSIEKATIYAKNTPIPEGLPEGAYIRLEMERVKAYATKAELKIECPVEVRSILEEEYAYQLAAVPKQVFKGKNWYGIVEKKEKEAALVLYLSQEFIGKNLVIKLKGKVLFEGVVESDKIIIENLPLLSDYSFLEEELEFQV